MIPAFTGRARRMARTGPSGWRGASVPLLHSGLRSSAVEDREAVQHREAYFSTLHELLDAGFGCLVPSVGDSCGGGLVRFPGRYARRLPAFSAWRNTRWGSAWRDTRCFLMTEGLPSGFVRFRDRYARWSRGRCPSRRVPTAVGVRAYRLRIAVRSASPGWIWGDPLLCGAEARAGLLGVCVGSVQLGVG